MKVYIAGKVNGLEVSEIASQIEDLGHEITYKWWEGEKLQRPYLDNLRVFEVNEGCRQGVYDADSVIIFSHVNGKGLYYELGYVTSLIEHNDKDVKIYHIGDCDLSTFLNDRNITQVSNLEELLEIIK